MNFNKEKHAVKVNKIFMISKSPICFMQSVFEVNFLLSPPGAVKLALPIHGFIQPSPTKDIQGKKKKITESSQKQTGNYNWQLQSSLGMRGVLVPGPLTYTKSADDLEFYIKWSNTTNTIAPLYPWISHPYIQPTSGGNFDTQLNPWIQNP